MTPKSQIKRLTLQTTAMLALAIGVIAGAVWLSFQPAKIQGPSALAVRPDGQVWLAVDRELWLISPQGDLIQTIALSATAPNSPGVANVSAPTNDAVWVNFRGDASVHKLDSVTGKLLQRTALRTSAHLVSHLERAPTMAASVDGRLAFATGGGHTVLVFDVEGAEIASTREGTYRFTNGLWWAEEGLWTTDTNGFSLKRLDPKTAAVLETVKLDDSQAHRFLGPATASQGASRALGSPPPVATVVRLTSGMTSGKLVDVFADGSQRAFGVDASNPDGAVFEARDVGWIPAFGATHALLATDGQRYQVKRFDAMGTALPDFGSAEVKRNLSARKDRRAHLELAHKLALGVGIALFGLAAWMASRLARLQRERRLAELDAPQTVMLDPPAAGQTAAASIDTKAMISLSLQAFWPLYALAVALVGLNLVWPQALGSTLQTLRLPTTFGWVVAAAVVLALAMTWVTQRWLRARALRPELEPLFNHTALGIVARSVTVREALQRGEHVLEACTLTRGLSPSLMVLTGQRLLWFDINARDQALTKSEALAQVIQADTCATPSVGLAGWLGRLGFGTSAELVLHFSDGSRLDATCASPLTLRRVVRAINADTSGTSKNAHAHHRSHARSGANGADTVANTMADTIADTGFETEFLDDLPTVQDFLDSHTSTESGFATTRQESARRRTVAHGDATPGPTTESGATPALAKTSALTAALLSALIPGSGQWLQGRFGTGLLMFVSWLVIIIAVTAPTLHAWVNSTTEVSAPTAAIAGACSVLAQVVAAWDAWRLSPRA